MKELSDVAQIFFHWQRTKSAMIAFGLDKAACKLPQTRICSKHWLALLLLIPCHLFELLQKGIELILCLFRYGSSALVRFSSELQFRVNRERVHGPQQILAVL